MALDEVLPTAASESGSREFEGWRSRVGADLAAAADEEVAVVFGYDMATVGALASGLQSVSPEQVWYHWDLMINEPEQEVGLPRLLDDRRDTYYFRTRADVWGALQIDGFSNEPRGVKVRYKLVGSEGGKPWMARISRMERAGSEVYPSHPSHPWLTG